MFKILLESGRLEDAWRIALRYRHIPNITDGDRLLQEVCDHPSISHILKAKALLSIAKYHELDEDPTKCHQLYASAKSLFEACDHAYGTISVDLALAYRKAITEGYTPACEKVMTGSIKFYETLDYPAGLLQALEKLLLLAEKCHHFDTIDNTRREIETISKRSGSYLLSIPSHIARIGTWKLRSGTEGKVIMAAKALYQELKKNDIVYLQGLAALHVSMAYYDIRDGDQALSWAEKTQAAWKGCRRIDQSHAACHVLRAKLLLAGESQNTQPLVDLTERLVEIDLADSLDEEATLKLDALATHIFRVYGKFGGKELNLFQSLMNRIRALISRLPDRQARLRLAGLYQNSALPIVQEAEKEMDMHKYGEAIDILEEAFQLYKQESELALQAFTRQLQGVVGHSMFMKLLTRDATSARNVLEYSIKWFRVAKEAFRAVNLVRQVIECSYWEALLNYDAWTVGWKSGVSVLELFYEVEYQYGILRGELSALRSLDAVSNKQRLTSNKHVRDIYRLSFQICLKEYQHSAAWAWIQSAKARSLSDLLGLGAFVPRTLLDRIRANDEAFRMFEADTALSKRIASAPSTEHFQARVDLEHLYSQMRGLPVLKELLDLREGTSVSLFDLQEQLSRPEFKPKQGVLVLVDWVFKQDEIYMFTVKASEDPTIDILPLNVSTVQEWVRQYLVNQSGHEQSIKMDDQHEGNALRQLDGLVLPLSSLSDPEDLLVFSPTGVLHSIPLHALHIWCEHKSVPVIERNPVVYCASVTSFFQCSQRAIDRPTREVSWRSILAVYEPEPGRSFDRLEKEEQGNVYVLAENLSEVYHFDKLLRGAEVARSAITDILQGSEMIIFHGHCDADENGNDILKQGLRLVGPDGTNCKLCEIMPSSRLHTYLCSCVHSTRILRSPPVGILYSSASMCVHIPVNQTRRRASWSRNCTSMCRGSFCGWDHLASSIGHSARFCEDLSFQVQRCANCNRPGYSVRNEGGGARTK
jgi:hypothetical protein